MDALDLLGALVRAPSVAGGEGEPVRRCASLLEQAGLATELISWASGGRVQEGREQLVARTTPVSEAEPLTLTGHVDTVPADPAAWSFDPWSAGRDGDRVLGRGTSDMKSGVAALVTAVAAHARHPHRCRGLQVVLTAGEETGCTGALALPRGSLAPGGPLLVAEPTANRLLPGHKGALWLRLTAAGRAAHGSAPELGDNAAVRLARAAVALHDADSWPGHPRFGPVTANVGRLCGGAQPNVVPDTAELLLDLRPVPDVAYDDLRAEVARLAGDGVRVEDIVALPPIDTPLGEPFVGLVGQALSATGLEGTPQAPARFFTDASALVGLLQPRDQPRPADGVAPGAGLEAGPGAGVVPTVILGPGEPDQCHVVDEWCSARRVEEAVEVYAEVLRRWCS